MAVKKTSKKGLSKTPKSVKSKKNEAALKEALEEANLRSREVTALLKGSSAVLRYGDFKTVARAIFDSCKELIGASAGYIALLSSDGAENEVVFLDPGTLSCTVDPTTPMPIRGLRETTYRTGEAAYENDFKSSKWVKLLPGGHVGLDNVLFAPLVVEGKVVGLLGLANKPCDFTENDRKMAAAFGELAAVALYNNRAIELLKSSEKELNRHRVHLESIVAERTFELIQINEQLEYEISAHRRAENEALERGRQFENLMQIVPIGIAITTFDGKVRDANSSLLKIFGLGSKEEMRELSALSFYKDPADRGRFLGHLERGGVKNFEAVLKRKDGSEFWASMASIIKDDSTGKQIITIVEDITERRKLDEERLRMQKLESVGLLAGGIAHDFNNALAAILTNISVARMSEDPGSKTFKLLSAAEKASLRARNLTNQLLTFSKGGVPVKKPLSLKDLIMESSDFAITGSNSKCECHIDEHLWAAEVDEGQITQVLSNLIINASQAMPNGGSIRLKAMNAFIGDSDVPPLRKGRYITISVQDYGTGIHPEDLPRIFDPYFTTKPKGTGLGLATTYSIVKNHFGHITVESKAGEGAVFHVYLPASGERPAYVDGYQRAFLGHGTSGRVLVMDDETDIRESLGAALAIFGYKVSFAGNGEEAIELYKIEKENGKPFDAVIMDLTVPGGMGGKEAIKKLNLIDPEVRAIVSSGYSNDPVMADYAGHGFCGVVIKPFQIEELVRELQKATGQADKRPSLS